VYSLTLQSAHVARLCSVSTRRQQKKKNIAQEVRGKEKES
jgi:hypothetical protein